MKRKLRIVQLKNYVQQCTISEMQKLFTKLTSFSLLYKYEKKMVLFLLSHSNQILQKLRKKKGEKQQKKKQQTKNNMFFITISMKELQI